MAIADKYPHVKAENDWAAQQVAQYPTRLRAVSMIPSTTCRYGGYSNRRIRLVACNVVHRRCSNMDLRMKSC